MNTKTFPVIDPEATGRNIRRLRQDRGLSVREMQRFFGFEGPRAIYMWQQGQCLPSVDNLYALSALLEVPMNEILVSAYVSETQRIEEQQADACCSVFFGIFRQFRLAAGMRRNLPLFIWLYHKDRIFFAPVFLYGQDRQGPRRLVRLKYLPLTVRPFTFFGNRFIIE